MKQTNSSVSKYIGLVVVFFIPLISNLLHYVVIEHEFGKRSHELEWVEGGKVHYCDQYLFKIHPAIEVPCLCLEIVPLVVYNSTVLTTSEIVEQRVTLFYFNRGPPLA
ncbi:hypothetical protein [Myroides fluvii]|uniref:hypothetical protein n=1 Tax=Myroides fluvii TaxID=2572594 RepID=UPI00131C41E9|nr:hypothetical protein [Myroides fluvii]